jgi:hypothetical protein
VLGLERFSLTGRCRIQVDSRSPAEDADQRGQVIPVIATWAGSRFAWHAHVMRTDTPGAGVPISRTRCLFPAKPQPGAFVGNVR